MINTNYSIDKNTYLDTKKRSLLLNHINNYDENTFIEINKALQKELQFIGVNERMYFKIQSLPYNVRKSSMFFKFISIEDEDIYKDKIFEPFKMCLFLEDNYSNSIFFCKMKNGKIDVKVNNFLCINNPIDFFKNIQQVPYFYNNALKYNWSAQSKEKKHIKCIVIYSYKKEVENLFLDVKLSHKHTEQSILKTVENATNDDIEVSNHNLNEDKQIVYYINLEKDTERRESIESNYSYLNPIRIDAIKNNMGFIGLLKTNYYLLTKLINERLLEKCPIVMEDDCLLLDSKEVFLERWASYKKYLSDNWGKWNYFSGGAIYIKPLKIINKDPCIVECTYGLCTQFIVHGDTSSKKVIDYVNDNKMKLGIDRLLCSGKDTLWVPYPYLCIQKSKNTNICKRLYEEKYLKILQNEFKKSQIKLEKFVKENIATIE